MIEGEPQAQFGRRTAAKVLCCECGVPIESNAVNMCVACVRARVDITEGIPHNTQLNWCKFCDRYLQPPDSWVAAPLESKELLSVCLKRIKTSLIRVRLVDAAFVWTEPHSRRIKMKITIQKEVLGGAILQQSVIIEYVVQQQMCDDCRRAEAKDFWRAVVQIRQRCEHRKTLFYMEQLILKAKAHLTTTGIKPMPAGIDFFYAKQQDARKLYEFIQASLPVKMTHAQELMTHDAKNNVFDYKHTYCIEVAPICKDNVVCLPKKLAQQLGNLGQFCVVTRVSVSIHLIDPANGQCADISSAVYWREPFESLCQPRQLTEYTVIDCELIDCPTRGVGHGQVSMKHTIADVWVQRSSELGQSDAPTFNTRTHLGNILSPGDTVAGFDVLNCNVNNAIFDAVPRENLPDVILIKKVYSRDMRKRRRVWKLARLAEDMLETASIERDFDDFLDDLEEEPKLRTGINIYKDKAKQERVMAVEMDDEDEAPGISLQASHFVEMLDDLNLEDTAANLVAEFAEQNGEQME